jgi:hypothetical protein
MKQCRGPGTPQASVTSPKGELACSSPGLSSDPEVAAPWKTREGKEPLDRLGLAEAPAAGVPLRSAACANRAHQRRRPHDHCRIETAWAQVLMAIATVAVPKGTASAKGEGRLWNDSALERKGNPELDRAEVRESPLVRRCPT